MHEIVTLQFGQQANYVGTHFWNAQESYFTYGGDEESPVDHDIHFRPGIGADGSDTFTPRTVIYDLKGAFGTLRRDNALYRDDDSNQQSQWPGQTQVIQEPTIPLSQYQTDLDSGLDPPPLTTSSVRYWSDYNRVFYHPRSIVQLSEYDLNSSIAPFERWNSGQELFSNLDREHDLLDKDLRPFLEEADHLQAVQVFTTTDDAWGGFASEYMQRVRDELGKTGIWLWALEDGARKPREKQNLHSANVIQSLSSLSKTATLYVPITSIPASIPPYITALDPVARWHTSALQSTAIETLSLPSRLRSPRTSLDDFVSVLSPNGLSPIAHLSLSLSRPDSKANGTSIEHDERMPDVNGHANTHETDELRSLDIPFAPSVYTGERGWDERHAARRAAASDQPIYSQVQSLRGSFLSILELDELNSENRNRRSAAAAQGQRVTAKQTDLLVPVGSSMPAIYACASNGQVAAKAALSTAGTVKTYLQLCAEVAKRVVPTEDREDVVDGLQSLAKEYGDSMGSDSDEDDDE